MYLLQLGDVALQRFLYLVLSQEIKRRGRRCLKDNFAAGFLDGPAYLLHI